MKFGPPLFAARPHMAPSTSRYFCTAAESVGLFADTFSALLNRLIYGPGVPRRPRHGDRFMWYGAPPLGFGKTIRTEFMWCLMRNKLLESARRATCWSVWGMSTYSNRKYHGILRRALDYSQRKISLPFINVKPTCFITKSFRKVSNLLLKLWN